MSENAPSSSVRYRFLMVSDSGQTSDLTALLQAGAKLTVLFSQLCYDWEIPRKAKWAYHRLRRQLQKWAESGLIDYYTNKTNSCTVDIEERPGVFCRARSGIQDKAPCLIRSLQNSKTFAAPQFGLISEPSPTEPQPRYNWLPGGRISWYRIQAIRKLQKIRDPDLFIRRKDETGKRVLNPKLTQAQKEISKLFEVWKKDISRKNIVMRDISGNRKSTYLILNYKTRFTDNSRHWEIEKTYQGAVKKSLEQFDKGLFITLTSDPQIHMQPAGREFDRHVKDPQSKITYSFELEGQGGSLWTANRNESKAFRKWYEKTCHRFGCRIPYIRVVEFQKNGLIHTHLLMFGITDHYYKTRKDKYGNTITKRYSFDWEELARDWGERYNQGIMNQVYRIQNVSGKWEWTSSAEKPDDTAGRSPVDYLGKYLKKASDIPTIKCACGQICSSEDGTDIICPKCGKRHQAPADGRYMYWVMGKRFFTISQCLREYDIDAIIEKEDLKKLQTAKWEFIGTPENGKVLDFIKKDARITKTQPSTTGHGWVIKPLAEEENKRSIIRRKFADEENPDIDDESPLKSILAGVTEEQAAAVIEITTAEAEYQRLLQLEREQRKARREELKRRKEQQQT